MKPLLFQTIVGTGSRKDVKIFQSSENLKKCAREDRFSHGRKFLNLSSPSRPLPTPKISGRSYD